jgi:hypothetical protein
MTRRGRLALLLALLAVPLLLQGASVPHTHAGAAAGLFNQEHDLTLLATMGTVASDVPVVPAVIVVLVATVVASLARSRPATMFLRAADPRAPPAR